MRKVCWVTSDYFTDCDKDIVVSLAGEFSINWYLIYPHTNSRFKPADFAGIENQNLRLTHEYSKHRMRNPKNILFFLRILWDIRKQKPDVVYINFGGLPYFIFLAALLLKKSNTIFTAHQAAVHEGLDYKGFTKIYFSFWYSWFTFFNLFSAVQGDIFKKRYPSKKVFVIPLALKEFGKSIIRKKEDEIVFFNFGTIRQNKNIGCLIDAACNLYENGQRGFHIVLKGECENWDYYKQKIKFPSLFTCDIRQIDNDEIADMFNEYHYLVLPYSAVSQSGILKIAFNYNVPIIASDLDGFKAEIKDGVNGYLFKNNDVADLEMVLKNAILNHASKYETLKEEQRKHINENYNNNSIIEKYQLMFDNVISLKSEY